MNQTDNRNHIEQVEKPQHLGKTVKDLVYLITVVYVGVPHDISINSTIPLHKLVPITPKQFDTFKTDITPALQPQQEPQAGSEPVN